MAAPSCASCGRTFEVGDLGYATDDGGHVCVYCADDPDATGAVHCAHRRAKGGHGVCLPCVQASKAVH